ncbi:glutamate-5-semialdehyde dehydrogenase [Candidatus Bipolaricaulota bacterium]|nr:glutamate-5-semialdehyde dehydrogenase [Candidatus Bipolaricaulota bacterium]
MVDARTIAQTARSVSKRVAAANTEQKNAALSAMAERLAARKQGILAANEADLAEGRSAGLSEKLISRLRFGEGKIDARIRCLRKIEELPDPVGQSFDQMRCANGLVRARMRVPLGVVLMIYEARPHVTVNAGAFCLKSGNAAILRGGSEARRCNEMLGGLWRESLEEAGLPPEAVQVISGSHADVDLLLQLDDCIDLVIPRGGKGLIEAVSEKSRIPVIKHFAGVCHVYLDEETDISQGITIALDSKCLMPEVCNAMETLLVSESLLDDLPRIIQAFHGCGVAVRGCERTRSAAPSIEPATEEDWRTEYLDMIVSVRVVSGVGQAIEHINRYGSHHTDAIVTANPNHTQQFFHEIDSAVVLSNASTMFCDGESLGMGAEIGISTDRLHARGPMGLEELTTYKHVIWGTGQVMGQSEAWKKGAPIHGT